MTQFATQLVQHAMREPFNLTRLQNRELDCVDYAELVRAGVIANDSDPTEYANISDYAYGDR